MAYVPSSHNKHVEEPSTLAYWPAAHRMQSCPEAAPRLTEYLPIAHLMHDSVELAPSVMENDCWWKGLALTVRGVVITLIVHLTLTPFLPPTLTLMRTSDVL